MRTDILIIIITVYMLDFRWLAIPQHEHLPWILIVIIQVI